MNENNARMRHVTDTESYFENFLHVVRGISTETWRKPMSVWYFLEYLATYETAEAVVRICFVKKEFLKILQNSLENPCAWVNFIKKETLAQVLFSEFWEIFKYTFFISKLSVAASTASELHFQAGGRQCT